MVIRMLAVKGRPNTWKTHYYAWRQFRLFCRIRDAPYLPTTDDTVAIYLEYLEETTDVRSALESACSAINFVHCKLNNLPSPCDGFMVGMLRAMVLGERATAVQRKRVIPRPVLKSMLRAFYDVRTRKYDKLILGNILLGTKSLSRFSDLCRILKEHSGVRPAHTEFAFAIRKNEKVRTSVCLDHIGGPGCTATLWMHLAYVFPYDQSGALLKEFDHRSNRVLDEPMSYAHFMVAFRQMLVIHGVPADEVQYYGSQSMRRTGASLLSDEGVPDSVIDRLGNWHCPESKKIYTVPQKRLRLQAAKALMF